MKRRSIIIIAAILALLMIIATVAYKNLSQSYSQDNMENQPVQQETASRKAPDFTVQNSSRESVKLSDYKGKPVVINFWATWCPPCKSELPYFERLYTEYKDIVEFMMVNLTDGDRETEETVNEFIKETGYTFPVYYDTEYSAAVAYGTYSIPVTVFINKEGNIIHRQIGAMSENAIRGYIEKMTQS